MGTRFESLDTHGNQRLYMTEVTNSLDYRRLLLVVIRLTCLMHVIYARHAYMLPTLHPKKNQASINQQRIRIATQ